MHVYTSALMWRPLSSPIRNRYLTINSTSYTPQVKIGIESDSRMANQLVGHLDSVTDTIPHPNGQDIISLSSGQEGRLQLIQWDLKTHTKVWEKIWVVPYRSQSTQLVYSPDKTHILLWCSQGLVVYLRLENIGLKELWSSYSIRPTALAVSPTGNQAIYSYTEESEVSPAQLEYANFIY